MYYFKSKGHTTQIEFMTTIVDGDGINFFTTRISYQFEFKQKMKIEKQKK